MPEYDDDIRPVGESSPEGAWFVKACVEPAVERFIDQLPTASVESSNGVDFVNAGTIHPGSLSEESSLSQSLDPEPIVRTSDGSPGDQDFLSHINTGDE